MDQLPTLLSLGLNWGFKGGGWGWRGAGKPPREQSLHLYLHHPHPSQKANCWLTEANW